MEWDGSKLINELEAVEKHKTLGQSRVSGQVEEPEQSHVPEKLQGTQHLDEGERFEDAEEVDGPDRSNIFNKLGASNTDHQTDKRNDSVQYNESAMITEAEKEVPPVLTVVLNGAEQPDESGQSIKFQQPNGSERPDESEHPDEREQTNESEQLNGPEQSNESEQANEPKGTDPLNIVERMAKCNAEKADIRQVVDKFLPLDPFTWQSPTASNRAPCFCDHLESLTYEGFHRLATFCLGTGPILERGRHLLSFASELAATLSPDPKSQKRNAATSIERAMFDRIVSKHCDLDDREDKNQLRPYSDVDIGWDSEDAFCRQMEELTTLSKQLGCEIQWDDEQSTAKGEGDSQTSKKADEDDRPHWGCGKSSTPAKVKIESDDAISNDDTDIEEQLQLDEGQITARVKAGVETKMKIAKDAEQTAHGKRTSIPPPPGFPNTSKTPPLIVAGPTKKMADGRVVNTLHITEQLGREFAQLGNEEQDYVLDAISQHNKNPSARQIKPEHVNRASTTVNVVVAMPDPAAAAHTSKSNIPAIDSNALGPSSDTPEKKQGKTTCDKSVPPAASSSADANKKLLNKYPWVQKQISEHSKTLGAPRVKSKCPHSSDPNLMETVATATAFLADPAASSSSSKPTGSSSKPTVSSSKSTAPQDYNLEAGSSTSQPASKQAEKGKKKNKGKRKADHVS